MKLFWNPQIWFHELMIPERAISKLSFLMDIKFIIQTKSGQHLIGNPLNQLVATIVNTLCGLNEHFWISLTMFYSKFNSRLKENSSLIDILLSTCKYKLTWSCHISIHVYACVLNQWKYYRYWQNNVSLNIKKTNCTIELFDSVENNAKNKKEREEFMKREYV